MTDDRRALSISSQEAIEALAASDGDKFLAAEKLGLGSDIVAATKLTAIIASDPQASMALNERLRMLTVLATFDLFMKTKTVIESDLGSLEPGDLVKFFATVSTSLERMTDSKVSTQNINVLEVAMRMLPAEVREAIIAINGGSGDADAALQGSNVVALRSANPQDGEDSDEATG